LLSLAFAFGFGKSLAEAFGKTFVWAFANFFFNKQTNKKIVMARKKENDPNFDLLFKEILDIKKDIGSLKSDVNNLKKWVWFVIGILGSIFIKLIVL